MNNQQSIQPLTQSELQDTQGGLIGVVIGAAVAWMAIGAVVAWNMAKDNRTC